MKITCLGATRSVTGSCFQIELSNGKIILLDCGLFQGGRQVEMRNYNTGLERLKDIVAVVLTHAHMDHSGLVPHLIKNGYKGPIYATPPTCELLDILWQDGAYIQKQEAAWKNKKNKRRGGVEVEPLYSSSDAEKAVNVLKPLKFDEPTEILPGVILHFVVAGHILGASSVHFTIKDNGYINRVVFSGDLGRPKQLIMPDPVVPPPADIIFMETTYGNRLHKDINSSKDELVEVINQAHREGGKILIPAFAVERTQEILYLLALAKKEQLIPQDIPVILDSPLAIAATEIYLNNFDFVDQETQKAVSEGLRLPDFKATKTVKESQDINDLSGTAIIMAGSGMASAGRILHHLKYNLWRENCHVVIVGFQAQGTLGRRLVEGAKTVKIFREPVKVGAKIHTIGGFSGHADQKELIEWLTPQIKEGVRVNLIHGEESGTLIFEEKVKALFPQAEFYVPNWLETLEYTEGLLKTAVDKVAQTYDDTGIIANLTKHQKNIVERATNLQNLLSSSVNDLSPEKMIIIEHLLKQAEDLALRD